MAPTVARLPHLFLSVLAVVTLAAAAVFAGAGGASAAPVPAFYQPPADVPATPGSILRSEPSPLAFSIPAGGGAFPATGTRIMYASTDVTGAPIAVTGTYFEPAIAWAKPGPRPIISMAVGTHGQGDQCAPSRLFNSVIQYGGGLDVMVQYEIAAIYAAVAQGIPVVVTDYQGLGTPSVHGYLNRVGQANAVLDAARAAIDLKSLPDNTPVGMWGYSQGGGAVAGAAELQAQYAPELNVRGTYAGAPPVDPLKTLALAEGGILTGAVGYALNGVYADYPEARPELDRVLNNAGKSLLRETANQCVPETLARYAFQRTSVWTSSGRPLGEVATASPVLKRIFDQQRIGTLTPEAPILIVASNSDDVVPWSSSREVAREWCGRGATVQFTTFPLPQILPGTAASHGIPEFFGIPTALGWMIDRFTQVPQSRCVIA
ncbi:lipase family protein [Nocardia sp. 348MFTsu5.1]|uniref:lipase family protein n=1 Tax=Nocardia sp. 348MFTsu5.1 TaxID=1172185 RepID=UPI00035EB1DD|nr:lipase family protein [Nocardia sp. 348MFTsu5.1]